MDYHRKRQSFARRMIPLILAAFVVGFLFQLSNYDSMSIPEPSSPSSNELLNHRASQIPITKKRVFYDRGNELLINDEKEERVWLQPKLFDLNFTWVQNNESICEKRENDPNDLRLLPVLVHTARPHFVERVAIRKSWGSIPVYQKWGLRLVFLLGEAAPPPGLNDNETLRLQKENERLAEEQEKFGDVVIGNFIDTYHNLTYKHMMGYKWVLNFCSNATMVLKVDDDVFIDIVQWLDWLSTDLELLESSSPAASSVPDIYCKLWAKSKPFRKKYNKWYVSFKDWPKQFYPPFCSGWAYTIHVDLMARIYSLSQRTKFNWIDDVFVTGQLLQQVKDKYNYDLKIGDITREVTTNPGVYQSMCNSTQLGMERKFKAMAKVGRGNSFERDMMCMWNKTLVDNSKLLTSLN